MKTTIILTEHDRQRIIEGLMGTKENDYEDDHEVNEDRKFLNGLTDTELIWETLSNFMEIGEAEVVE
jgi:hypothetical protein